MAKIIKVAFPQKCIGCELCVFEVQRQLTKVGLEEAPIRIFKKKKGTSGFLEYSLHLDPRINSLNIEKLRKICPTEVFEIVEEHKDELIG